tara:strand:- start:1027 stop:1992 length:966 start_codon:yes stop_codon:yes gene_type:complete
MPYLSTNFLRRQKLTRSIGEFGGINTRPELTPKDNVQAHMNTMSSMGGGEIYLGPYDFLIQSEATDATDAATANFWSVPENVTLVGVPNRTKIYKTTKYAEGVGNAVVNVKSLGPVVSLAGPGASIVNCTVSLDIWTEYNKLGIAGGGGGRSNLYFTDDSSGGTKIFAYGLGDVAVGWENSCIIYMPNVGGFDGTTSTFMRRIDGCTIGDPAVTNYHTNPEHQSTIGVYIHSPGSHSTSSIISNNFFMNSCESHYTAGVYVANGSTGHAIVGNVARPFFGAGSDACDTFVSIEDATQLSYNAVTGNVPSNAASSTSYGLRS